MIKGCVLMKNKLFKLILFFIFFFGLFGDVLAKDLNIKSKEIFLVNLNEDKVLLEENADTKTYIASLTKMMTAIVALENVSDLNSKVKITNADLKGLPYDTSLSGLSINTNYTYLDLLYGLLLPSGADCANAIARNVGKNVDNFIKMMNDKAKELDMTNTHFSNTHGLDDAKNYSTARDMAKLFSYSLKNPTFMKIVTTMNYKKMDHTIYYYTTKYDLSLPYLKGGKTGNDTKAGFCLASIAEADGVKYLLVTLNAPYSSVTPNHFVDAKTIYEYYINNYGYHNILKKNDVLKSLKTEYLKEDSIEIKADKDYMYYLENNYQDTLNISYDGVEVVTSDYKKGDYLGTVVIKNNDEVIDEIKLFLDNDVHFSLLKYLKGNKEIVFISLGVLLFLIVLVVGIIKKRKKNFA